MLNCFQKFNIDFFKEEVKELSNSKYTLEACVKYIIDNSVFSNGDNKIILKSYDSEGFRESLKETEKEILKHNQKYIIMGTAASIGQGANIKFLISDRKSAEEMDYIVVNDNPTIEACIDTLYIETPTFVLNLLDSDFHSKNLIDYIMRLNLLLTSNEIDYKKYRELILKTKQKKEFNNHYMYETLDYYNNVNGEIIQMLGRIPRGNAYKKDINIIVENRILDCVAKSHIGNVEYNTFEYIELYKEAIKASKPSRRNIMESKKHSNANDAFESKQSEFMNKLNLAKKVYKMDRSDANLKYLNEVVENREKFINKVISSLHNRDSFDVRGAYFKFSSEKYFYAKKSGVLEISDKGKSGFSSFSYKDLRSELFCQITGHDKLSFAHLSDDFDQTIMPVPSLVMYLKGFLSEYYLRHILENCFNAEIVKIPNEIHEDCDILIKYSGKLIAIDVKTSSLQNYNKNNTMETKIANVKNVFPDAKYVVIDLFEEDVCSMVDSESVSRFSGLIDTSDNTLSKIEFTEFVKLL